MRTRRPVSPAAEVAIYARAYRLQAGEFYPEHHLANVAFLQREYTQHSRAEIDRIYRCACRIRDELESWGGGLQLTMDSRQELLDWFWSEFPDFTEDVFSEAIADIEIDHAIRAQPLRRANRRQP